MGTWSYEPLSNDTAADWLETLLAADDLGPIESALDAVLAAGHEYLDADLASEAVAAVEVLARLAGGGTPHDDDTSELDRWVAAHVRLPDTPLHDKAALAIDRVLGDASELRDLWDETEDADAWRTTLVALAAALRR